MVTPCWAAVEAGFQGKAADTMNALLAGEPVNSEGISREGKRLRITRSAPRAPSSTWSGSACRSPATAEQGSFLKVLSTIPGLSQQHLPVLATLKGGRELTLRVTVPRQTLASLLAFVGPFLGRGTLGAR